ncbi:MAG: amidohydrolase family protein [Planctomycetes bacterium]|nr:amidohydrolase family protein [Planctomycetota bacterium]
MHSSIRWRTVPSILVLLWSISWIWPVMGQTDPVLGLHGNTPRVFALTNARIVTQPGAVLEGATLLVRDGSIEQVGTGVTVPPDAVVRDLTGKTIYPGFIDLYTDYGLAAGTTDGKVNGATHWNSCVLAQRRASVLVAQDPPAAEDLRKAGFGAAVTFPQGGIFRGTGALVLLDRRRPNQIILAEDVAQAMSLWYRDGRQYPVSLMGAVALIRQTLLDTQWYDEAWTKFRQAGPGQTAPETNAALAALCPCVRKDRPVVMQVADELDILRVSKIAQEFGVEMWVVGTGYEYRRLAAIKETGLRLIVPVNFPKAPDVSCLEQELRVSLDQLRHWDFAPENPGRLAQSGVDFVLTTAGLRTRAEFLAKVRLAVRRGLPPETALAALTTKPAEWLGLSPILGSLQKGKLANFVVTDGDVFAGKTRILETWVGGDRFVVTQEPDVNLRGQWTFVAEVPDQRVEGTLKISGTEARPAVTLVVEAKETKAVKVTRQDRVLTVSLPGTAFGCAGWVRLTGIAEDKVIKGHGLLDDARRFTWRAESTAPAKSETAEDAAGSVPKAEFAVVYPEGAFGRSTPPPPPEALIIKDATVWTCGPEGILSPGDVLIKGGKVAQVGRNLTAPAGAVVVNAAGKHLTPGLIDAHSHVAIRGGVNESTHAVAAETRIEDVLDSDDINIYRQLAGGLTTTCAIHGSANPIGGTYAVLKLKWGALPEEMLIRDARPGLKLALGENVKRSSDRYPNTRMGTVEIMRDAFLAAKDYRRQWQTYRQQSQKNRNLIPPRTDLRLECLLNILDHNMLIHCHAYRQDEINAMMEIGNEVGCTFDVFIHVLEGYKVAAEMKQHGAMATTFSDWWAYKMEAYDAIPFNGALMREQGVLVSFNSDSQELARRMNTEAAKAVKYGGVPPEEALKFVTWNAARHLCLEQRLGSLEPGKEADFVVWSHSPLSTYSICEQTWIEGRKYFDLEEDRQLRVQVAAQRARLIQKILDESHKARKDQDTTPEKPAHSS